jgi:hypothetical protein
VYAFDPRNGSAGLDRTTVIVMDGNENFGLILKCYYHVLTSKHDMDKTSDIATFIREGSTVSNRWAE